MNLESQKVTVNKSAAEMHSYLADVKNFENLMPENISKFELINDRAFVFALNGMPEIPLELKENAALDKVVLGSMSDKLSFNLIADIEPVDESTSKVQLRFEGEFNAMMAMMIKGPISKFMETLTNKMSEL